MGCQAGWPLNSSGQHIVPGSSFGEIVACTAEYYTHLDVVASEKGKINIETIQET